MPLLAKFTDWLERERVRTIPGTPIAKAIGYAVNQWDSLNVYVRDGRLAIDRVERWRGGLGQAHRLPALSSAGASLA